MSRIRKSQQPFYWQPFAVSLTNGTATTLDVSAYVSNPQGLPITYSVYSGALPAGCTFSASTITFSGAGAEGSSQVQFRAAYGAYSAESAQVTVATTAAASLGAPANLQATQTASTFVTLAWAAVPNATGYKAEYNAGSAWVQFATSTATTVTQTGLSPSTQYSFRVRATNAAGDGPYSSTLFVTTLATAQASSILADYQARASGAGVLWSHRFTSPRDPSLYWAQFHDNFSFAKRCGYIGTDAPQVGKEGVTRVAEGVIPDTGCLEMYAPATPVGTTKYNPVGYITAITRGSPTVITLDNVTGLSVGSRARLFACSDALHNNIWPIANSTWDDISNNSANVITAISGNQVTISTDTTNYPAWTSGGYMHNAVLNPDYIEIGAQRWSRPFAACNGVQGITAQATTYGTAPAYNPDTTAPDYNGDVNRPGWRRVDMKIPVGRDSWNKMAAAGGGLICSPSDYSDTPGTNRQRLIPGNSKTQETLELVAGPADGIYFQYFVKFPTHPNGDNLLDYKTGRVPSMHKTGAWTGKSWLSYGHGGDRYFPQEWGSLLWGDASFAPIHYGNRAAYYLGGQQSGNSSVAAQNALVNSSSCSYSNQAACWLYPKDKWVCVLVHIVPGTQNISPGYHGPWEGSSAYPGPFNQDAKFEVWVADEDRIRSGLGYLKLVNVTNFAQFYDGDYSTTYTDFTPGRRTFTSSNDAGKLLLTVPNGTAASSPWQLGYELMINGSAASLPGGLSSRQAVYCVPKSATEFYVATSKANALAGTVVPYTTTGSGTVSWFVGPGHSFVQFLNQMNISAPNSPYPGITWYLYDQITCSTNFIPCPTVI
jgi:hypothetical protein